MKSANYLPQLIPARARMFVERLGETLWVPIADLAASATAARPHHRPLEVAIREPRKKVRPPQHWGKLWDQRRSHLALPPDLAKRRDLFLEWRDQAEATLHLNGRPWRGFDPAHGRAPLPGGHRELWVEAVCCQTGVWHPAATGLDPQGSRFEGARLVRRDEALWAFYHDFKALEELAREELKRVAPGGVHHEGFQHRPDSATASPPATMPWAGGPRV